MTDDQARQYIVKYMGFTIGIVKRRKTMYTLVVIRHGESEWNQKNLFCGWTDVELTEKGYSEAREAGRLLAKEGFTFDKCYTSVLKRAIHTAYTVLDEMDLTWIPVEKNYHLNERHYGALQGLNKTETTDKYGSEQERRS